jgi:Ca2+-binding RTX toxin-like protein
MIKLRVFLVVAIVGGSLAPTVGARAQDIQCLVSAGPGQIYGTVGDDVIEGTPDNDVIYGLGGNDIIKGRGGSDLICAGPGNDKIYPGSGLADSVDAGEGDNIVYDVDGMFRVFAGAGDDFVLGAWTVDAGAGNDYVDSSDYPDSAVLFGGDGDDTLIGSDALRGSSDRAVDRLYGGAGNDSLYGGRSGEWFWPGAGDDEIRSGPHNGWASIVYFEESQASVRVDLARHIAKGEGTDDLWGIDGVVGSSFGDVLIGNARGNILRGCGGADLLVGRAGSDFLQGDDFDPDADHCPGPSSEEDVAHGKRGRDVCGAELMVSCEKKEGDPENKG